MFEHNYSQLQIVFDDIKCKRNNHFRDILINIGILAVLIALIVLIIVLIVKASSRETIEITTQREINITIVPDLPLEEKEQLVFDSLIARGYSVAGACGIMGNIAVESPDFDPEALGPGGEAYGLFQWTEVGHRKHKLHLWCKNQKLSPNSIEGQLAYAVFELSGGDSIACRLDDYLRKTDDAYTACVEFAAGFERCIASRDDGCGTYTGSLYPEFYGEPYQGLNRRINKAMNYYERFHN